MVIDIEVVKMMVYCVVWFKDNGMDYNQVSVMVKFYVLEVVMKYMVEVVQIYGGYGFVKEYYVECFMCDVKIMQIYEGIFEVQQIVISCGVL